MPKKLTIQEMRNLAKERGGKCLSKVYVNSYTHLKIKCEKNHIFKITPNHLKNGRWCRKCYFENSRLTIKEMQEWAKKKEGICLSKKYLNNSTHLKFKCKEGHTFKTRPSHIKKDRWCPYCFCNNLKSTLKQMQERAKRKNGKCVSKIYVNAHSKLKWQCSEGHVWKATPNDNQAGRWCPYCNSYGITEELCRKYIESMFRKKFPKKRPLWLKNSRGNRMELDGYCESLQIAFEYHGEQHYEFNKFFHRGNKDNLTQRKKDDKRKEMLCKKNGVFLIIIPYTVPKKELKKFIKEKAKSFLNL